MTKEEFLEKSNILDQEILEIKSKKQKLENDYISSNKEFEDGDLVSVSKDGILEKGIVFGYEISYSDVRPIVFKIKKNGEKSQHKVWLWGKCKIEKI